MVIQYDVVRAGAREKSPFTDLCEKAVHCEYAQLLYHVPGVLGIEVDVTLAQILN